MNAKASIVTLLLPLLFLSCRNRDVVFDLEKAEACMQEHPDSSLAILESVDRSGLRTAYDRALFSVLYAQALDKNDINITDTEIVMPAVKYFDRRGPSDKAMKAWFYLAREQENAKDYSEAMVSYMRAKDMSAYSKEPRFKGLIAMSMADVYRKTHNLPEFFAHAEESRRLYDEAGDSVGSWKALGQIALAQTSYCHWDIADSLFREFIDTPIRDSIYYPFCLLHYAKMKILRPDMDPEGARRLMDEAIEDYGYSLSIYNAGLYAYVCALLGDDEVCDDLLSRIEELGPEADSIAYTWKADIYKHKGMHEAAMLQLEHELKKQSALARESLEQAVPRAQRDYLYTKNELLQMEQAQIRKDNTTVILILLILVVMLWSAVSRMRRRWNAAREEIGEIQEESRRQLEELGCGIDSKNEMIYSLRRECRMAYLEQFRLLDELCAEYWSPSRRSDKERIYNRVKEILAVIGGDSGKSGEFEARLNEGLDNVMLKLREDFPEFGEEDYRFVSYVIAGFGAKTIAAIMDVSVGSVYTRKSRMKDRILSAKSKNTELYVECLG